MLPIRQWFDIDGDDHNADWGNECIRWIRMQMQPLVNVDKALLGMNYLMGSQDMSAIKNTFLNPAQLNLNNRPESRIIASGYLDDPEGKKAGRDNMMQPEMAGVEFKSLPIFEKTRNVMIAEMKKMGIIVDCRATDPTSTVARQQDEGLIRNKKDIEGLLSYVYASIGQKPVKLSDHKARFGEKHDNGNTQLFDAMGLDPSNPDDINFFMNHFHKLAWEIDIQKVVDSVLAYNETEREKFDKWTLDAIAKKATGGQLYISNENGGIIVDYVTPETIYIYGGGRRKDYNDANAKCIQQLITIKEFLDRVGNSFDYASHLDKIILAVFTASNGSIDITGINPDYGGVGWSGWYCKDSKQNMYSQNQFMQFKILFGYIEWQSQEETDYGKELSATKGNKFENTPKKKGDNQDAAFTSTVYEDNQNPDGKKYQTKARYETPLFKAYFLAITAIDHIMFSFGKATYQDIKGYNDYNSNFSIICYKEIGDPIPILAIPMVDLINLCWYKYLYEIKRAKPRGTNYNYDSIMAIAKDLFLDAEMTDGEKFEKIISWRDRSANGVWKFPVGDDGKTIMMTPAQLDQDMPNGLTPEVLKWWEIMVTTWDKLTDILMGTADLRQGDTPQERSSMNNEFKALEYSQNSTYYIPDMLTFMCRSLAGRIALYAQDIIQFKDYDTLAYKWLSDLVGDEALDSIEGMGKTAMHRFGIFVESLNQAPKMLKLSNRIDFALQNGKITNAEALLVEEIKSPTLAYLTLAYFEQRQQRIAQQQAQQAQQQQQQGQMQLEQMRQKTEQIKVDGAIQVATITANAAIQAHIVSQQGGLAKQEMKQAADSQQIEQQAIADLKVQQQNLNTTGKTTPPGGPPAPPQPQSPGGPPAPPQAPDSGIRDLIGATTPGANITQQ